MNYLGPALLATFGAALGIIGSWFGARWQLRTTRELERLKLANVNRGLLHDARVQVYSEFFRKMSVARPILRNLRSTGDLQTKESDAWQARNGMWDVYTRLALIAHMAVQDQAYRTIRLADDVIRDKKRYDEEEFSESVRHWIAMCRSTLIPSEADQPLDVSRFKAILSEMEAALGLEG
jgi:hypothetical protein